MRNEKQMLELIISTAEGDERIRAVYMNGSRTNAKVPKDKYRDYDIVYVVTDTASFVADVGWINRFGTPLIVQEPDRLDESMGRDVDWDKSYAYLMLFDDGSRIDLTLRDIDNSLESYLADKLTVLLLDKDGILPAIAAPSDEDYWIERPTEAMYDACCNEFWWCMQNVAKGIWRQELPYAKEFFETIIRNELNKMIDWWIGANRGYDISTGKMGKYFEKYLPSEYWILYTETFSDADYSNFWKSIFAACHLFRELAQDVATRNNYTYNVGDDENMMLYITKYS